MKQSNRRALAFLLVLSMVLAMISLPAPEVTAEGNITITGDFTIATRAAVSQVIIEAIRASNPNDFSTAVFYPATTITIPADTNNSITTSYSITLPGGSDVFVRYYVSSGGEGFIRQGYYATAGTTGMRSLATLVTGSAAQTGINLSAIPGVAISGTVEAPVAPSTDLSMIIDVRSQSIDPEYTFARRITLPAQSTSVAFTMMVPYPSTNPVTYRIQAKPENTVNYANSGYAEYQVSPNGTVNGPEEVLMLSQVQLSGTVYKEGTTPANKGWVELRNAQGIQIAQSNIGSNGSYAIGGIPAGTYNIKANPNSGDLNYTPSTQGSISIPSPGAVQLNLTFTKPQIRGTVLVQGGTSYTGIGYIEIRKIGEESSPLPSVNLGLNGSFVIGGLTEGAGYTIKAQPRSTMTSSASDTIVVTPGATAIVQNLTLNAVQLSGSVTLPTTGNLATNSWVQPIKISDDPNFPTPTQEEARFLWGTSSGPNSSYPASDGNFALGGLSQGFYKIQARPQQGSAYGESAYQFFSVSGAGATASPGSLSLPLLEAQISGQIVQPGGAAQPYGIVDIKYANKTNYGFSVDREGKFKITGLNDGDTVTLTGHPGGSSDFAASNSRTLTYNGEPITGVVLTLKQPQLSGYLRAPDGSPVSGGVNVMQEDGYWMAGVPVRSDGKFNIASLAPGTYKISGNPAPGSNYTESDQSIIEIDSNGAASPATLDLQLKAAFASGTVKSPGASGSAMAHGWIEVKTSPAGMYLRGIGVDRFGKFNLYSLENGDYELKAHPGAFASYSSSDPYALNVSGLPGTKMLTLNGATVVSTELDLRLNNIKISGTVKNPTGGNAWFGWVEVLQMNPDESITYLRSIPVDSNGKFNIGKLGPAGTYQLKARPDWTTNFAASPEFQIAIDEAGGITAVTGAAWNVANGVDNLTITLQGIQFSGILKKGDNSTAQNGWIQVQKQEDGSRIWSNGIGVRYDGTFSVGGLADGTYYLKAYPDYLTTGSLPSEEYEISISGNGANIVCSPASAYTTTNGNSVLTMTLGTPHITGQIQKPDGSDAPYGWVEIRNSATKEHVISIGASANGHFALDLPASASAGAYEIVAYPGAGLNYTRSQPQIITKAAVGSLDMELPSGGLVLQLGTILSTGSAVLTSGATYQSAWIEIGTESGGGVTWIASVPIDANFEYKIPPLSGGDYVIQGFTPDHKSSQSKFTVSASDIAWTSGTSILNIDQPRPPQ